MLKKNVIPHIIILSPILFLIGMKNYAYYWDGVEYSWKIENLQIKELFHRHHLLYTPFCKLIYLFLKVIGFEIRAIDVLIWINIIFGIFFLAISFMILRRLIPNSPFSASIGTLLISFSYTFGHFFRNADPYIIPIALLAFILLRISDEKNGIFTFRVDVFSWLLLFFAVLIHQLSILFLPALMYAQIVSFEKRYWKKTVFVFLVFIVALLITYLVVFITTRDGKTLEAFIKWMSGYATRRFWIFQESEGFFPSIGKSIFEGIMSNITLFLAPVIKANIRLPENFIYDGDPFFGNLVCWILFIILLWLIFDGLRKMYMTPGYKRISKFMLIWLLPYIIFLQFFTPYNYFYRLFYLLPLSIAIVYGGGKLIKPVRNKFAGSAFLTAFFLLNFIFGYIPDNIILNNRYLVMTNEIVKYSTRDDLFIFPASSDYKEAVYLKYFGDRDIAFFKQFPVEEYSELTDQKLKSICNESREWLIQNYDKLFIAFSREVGWTGYNRYNISSSGKNAPYLLLLNQNQLSLNEKYVFAEKSFRTVILHNITSKITY